MELRIAPKDKGHKCRGQSSSGNNGTWSDGPPGGDKGKEQPEGKMRYLVHGLDIYHPVIKALMLPLLSTIYRLSVVVFI